jgi:hypothetical protein
MDRILPPDTPWRHHQACGEMICHSLGETRNLTEYSVLNEAVLARDLASWALRLEVERLGKSTGYVELTSVNTTAANNCYNRLEIHFMLSLAR